MKTSIQYIVALAILAGVLLTACKKGDPGVDGKNGATGAIGATGPTGSKGDKGDTGDGEAWVKTVTVQPGDWVADPVEGSFSAEVLDTLTAQPLGGVLVYWHSNTNPLFDTALPYLLPGNVYMTFGTDFFDQGQHEVTCVLKYVNLANPQQKPTVPLSFKVVTFSGLHLDIARQKLGSFDYKNIAAYYHLEK